MAQPQALVCKGCWQNLHVPMVLRGPLSVPFRVVGLKPSRMNPNTCTFCELMFSRVMKATKITIDATILFADLRAYTRLSQEISPAEMGNLLDLFYDECAAAIWEHDGLLNKTIGDAVMAVFNFPIKQGDHARQALLAAREIQQRLAQRKKEAGLEFGVGIGLQSGEVSFGEFGRSHRDLTAIGTVVNTAARVQAVAEPGEILVTEAMRERVGDALGESTAKPYELKGFDKPVMLYRA
ncbi:MAG TPA: adenylate/guanylate cyclase domain-containing protein [Reyranella sp.]|jgi:adenylate cyclase|nr:adenylate/guanylate cyclase domain-containing protein [Reyranella sp.]